MTAAADAGPYLDEHADRFVEELRAACRIPSVSAVGGEPLMQMARSLERRLSTVLDRVELLPTPGDGPPAVYGELRGTDAAAPRILLYSHYDVQPPEPLEKWKTGPFDDKADVYARIHALETLRATRGRPRFTIVWLSEGAEEIASKGLGDLLRDHRELAAFLPPDPRR